MEFLTFLVSTVRALSFSDPKVISFGVVLGVLALTRSWLLIAMSFGVLVIGKAVEFYTPDATGSIVADMSLVQIIYIVGGVIIAIVGLGQFALRH